MFFWGRGGGVSPAALFSQTGGIRERGEKVSKKPSLVCFYRLIDGRERLVRMHLRDGSALNSPSIANWASSKMAFKVLWLAMTAEAKVLVASMWATLGPE